MPATASPAQSLFDRVPPQDLEAERSVLGSCLLQNDVIDDVLMHLREGCFYNDSHQRVFRAILAMHESGTSGIDLLTVRSELERRDDLEDVGGPAYLMKILETVPHAAHVEHYAQIVRNKWLQRNLIDTCTEILKDVYHSPEETDTLLARAESRVFSIFEQQNANVNLAIGDILDATFDRIFKRMDQEGTISGIHTGFDGLDAKTSGYQNSDLLILAARPSMGKTAFVCNSALAVAKNGVGVALFSLEQSALDLGERFLSIQARVDGHKMRQGDLTEEDQFCLHEASNVLRETPLYIDDVPGRTISQITAISRRMKRRNDIGLVIIDYLQLIESDDKRLPREQQISTITRRLKFLAKDLSVPVIALSQLNRGVEQRDDKRPRLADLRESGSIEQDADIVMFLHRPEAYDPEDRPGEADLIIAKNRSGPIGTAPLVWLKEQLRFGDRAPEAVSEALDF